jgi:16S rRNA (guanine527-N7)-methyltransferase
VTEQAIEARAAAAGLVLSSGASRRIATHAGLVMQEAASLHLTTIEDPDSFLERHIGEALEGAAMLDAHVAGTLLDLGSGNGYPGVPVALARPGLRPVLAESSQRKAAFLRGVLASIALDGTVLDRRVQRAADLEPFSPIDVLVTRAAEGWDAVLPRLASRLSVGGIVLIWAGSAAATIVARASWRRFELVKSHPLPGRSTLIFELRRVK